MAKNGSKLQTHGDVFVKMGKKSINIEKKLKKVVDSKNPLWYSSHVAEKK